jgi:purine-nucleoside/S-methyl-5'-thioadenosine phosphorylase / adenosine deaminase
VADLQLVAFGLGGRAGFHGRFTDRHDGVSGAPYDTANLAGHVGDDPDAVAGNRAALADRVGAPVVWMEQVHGGEIAIVTGAEPGTVAGVDGLVTTTPELALAVLVADCVPVLLVDQEAAVLGVAHAGRRGLTAGVVPRTAAAMLELGADPDRMIVWLGPSICGRCYEVPAALRDEAQVAAAGSASTTSRGTAGIDLRAGLRAQLRRIGRRGPVVRDVGPCTAESAHHFSHRRDGVTGRFAGVAVLRG